MARVETLLKICTWLCAATGFAAVVRYLDPSYVACFAGLAAIALFIDFKRKVVLPRWLLNVLSIFVLIPSAFRIGPSSLVEPVLNGLVLLLGIKLLENKKSRDYMQIYLICAFLLIGSTLISFSMVFLVYFFCLFSLSTLALMLLCYFAKGEELRLGRDNAVKLLSQAVVLCAIAIPACALFFLILPRTDFPLFGFLSKAAPAKSGFSDSVSLGDVSEIQEDSGVAFRAEMREVRDADLFWRGIELDRFDGKSWKKSPPRADGERPDKASRGYLPIVKGGRGDFPGVRHKKIPQTIYLEPSENRYLFALDRPVAIYAENSRHWKKAPVWNRNLQERTRYRAVSIASGFSARRDADKARYLQLPEGFSPRIVALSRRIAAGKSGTEAVRGFMEFFRTGRFEYSLENLPQSDAPLEEFILEKRRGNCEYFASALAVMLRAAGIPARLVGGYRGGYFNRAGSYYLVLQKNAHVWVEAYGSGGWMRLDPTPMVPIGPGQAYRMGILLRAKLLFDTFNYYWEKFVISYDLSEQFALWRKLRDGIKPPVPDLGAIKKSLARFAGLLPALAVVPLCFLLFRRMRRKPEKELVFGFTRKMQRRGYKRLTGEGLEEFAGRVEDPALRAKALRFAGEYQEIFYQDRKFSPERIKRLKSCIREL